MAPLSRPIRLLAEVLLIIGLTEVVVMWVMPVLAPGLTPWQESLLDVTLLLVLSAPMVYWRCMVFFHTPRATTAAQYDNAPGRLSFRQAVVWTVMAQVLGLLLTAGGVYYLHRDLEGEATTRFAYETDRLEREIARRFQQIDFGLSGLRANLAAAQEARTPVPLPRAVFQAHVAARSMRAEFPGVRGMGFIEKVKRSDVPDFEQHMRADGAPQYRVHTSGEVPDVFAIRNIEPLAGNEAALGFDVGQEPVRRQGIERAIASGEASLTAKITLVQDAGHTPGFLVFLPVFREGQAPYLLPDLRPATLVGLLYAPIVASELLDTTRVATQSNLDFTLYDGNDLSDKGRVYADSLPGNDQALDSGARSTQRVLRVGGRRLTLVTQSTAEFEALQDRSSLVLAGIGGSLLSLLAALATWLLAAGQMRAQNMARRMTHDLDRMARVVQHTHNAVAITDAAGVIEWVNAGFTRVLGYSAERAQGSAIISFISTQPADQEAWHAMLYQVQAGQSARTDLRIRAESGQPVWLDTEMQPIVDATGAVTGFMVIASDITLQKHAQLEKEMALREASTLLSTFEHHAIVSITDRQGTITQVNDAFCAISGYSSEELLGANHRIVNSGTHPPAFWEAMWADLTSGKAWRGDVCNRAKDGRLYWVDSIITPFIGDDGLVERYVSIRNEITHRYEQAQALQNALERAEQASLAKGQFLANMSHEIRTPMNAIIGMLRLLHHTELTPQQLDYADKSQNAAQSLLGLINDILDFSKIEAGKMTLDPQPLRIEQLLRDLGVILSVNVHNKDVDLLYDVDPALPDRVLCDGMRLQQVLLNLGGNAIKFTAQGQVVVAVRVVTQDTDTVRLEFAVTDSGIGIAPENQAHIFSGFSQAEASTTRKFGGTGLGLAISRRMVELMGGTLALDSRPGQGSTFSFVLDFPLVGGETPTLEPSKPLHALVVDDNPVARDLLARMVRSCGWPVQTASSGAEALQLLQDPQARFEVVYTDCAMPGMDGWELATRLHAFCSESGAHFPSVVMVSTQGREQLAQRSSAEQALLQAYLVKPVTASMLREATLEPQRGGAALRSSVRGPSSARRLRGMRLLVVEDNLINQQVAEELLASEGALVALAANGLLGVEAVAAAQPQFDAVLMDVQMPVMDGYTATRTIRSSLGLDRLPIIAMTANALESDRQECLQAGMSEHVGKPFDLDQLVNTLLRTTGYQVPALLPVPPPAQAEPSETLPQVDGLDVHGALERMGGMRSLYLRAASDFRQALPAVLLQLRQSMRSDLALATIQVHTLKGNAATLGASALANTAADVERQLKSGTGSGIALEPLESRIAQTLSALDQLLGPLADPVPAGVADWHAAMRKLAELLAQEDYACLDFFAQERNLLAGLPPASLGALEQALQGLDFAEAHRICLRLLQKQ
ncbi:MAG: response regulator [Rhodoferax sp.]|nr:MAG: response regulator [Rhodoferax sp.]